MDWQAALRRLALPQRFEDFDLLYAPAVRPPVPPEYAVPGLVAVTFRLRPRPGGGFVYVTALDLAAALRLGRRMGFDEGGALAMVDSHERVHVALQLEGVAEEVEEAQSNFVDAVWLSLRHPRLAKAVEAGAFGLVTRVRSGWWEELIDVEQA